MANPSPPAPAEVVDKAKGELMDQAEKTETDKKRERRDASIANRAMCRSTRKEMTSKRRGSCNSETPLRVSRRNGSRRSKGC